MLVDNFYCMDFIHILNDYLTVFASRLWIKFAVSVAEFRRFSCQTEKKFAVSVTASLFQLPFFAVSVAKNACG